MICLAKYSLLLAVLSVTCCAQMKMKVVEKMPVAGHNAPSTSNPPPHDNGIEYHGGPVMNDPHGSNVYFIWYGNWSNDTAAQTILTDFMKNIGGTAYFNINTSYYDYNPGGEKDPVVNLMNYKGSVTDNYSFGAAISDDDVACIVQNPAVSGKLPFDLNGQYWVLASPDVSETSGFCTIYCAFHGYDLTDPTTTQNGCGVPVSNPNQLNQKLIAGFIGNTNQCPNACGEQTVTPNNDLAADGMANMIAHETSEAVTDPYGTAWYDANFNENADKCLWTFGKTMLLPNGSLYNVKFGGRRWLIQQIWVNARGGYCALAFDE